MTLKPSIEKASVTIKFYAYVLLGYLIIVLKLLGVLNTCVPSTINFMGKCNFTGEAFCVHNEPFMLEQRSFKSLFIDLLKMRVIEFSPSFQASVAHTD